MSVAWITSDSAMTAARVMALTNSRMLPGQW
jgi:hypothetical protein